MTPLNHGRCRLVNTATMSTPTGIVTTRQQRTERCKNNMPTTLANRGDKAYNRGRTSVANKDISKSAPYRYNQRMSKRTSAPKHIGTHIPADTDTPIQESEPTHIRDTVQAHIREQADKRKPKRIPDLTPKQAKFVQAVVTEGLSKTDAYIEAYEHKGLRKTAHEEASRTASLPQVKLELAKYSGLAENTMIEVMEMSKEYAKSGDRDGAAYASVAVSAAKDVLDRVHGKATQRVETTSKSVNLNIDLTGVA